MYFDTTNRGSCSRASPDQIAEMNRSRSLDSPRYLSFYLTPIIHRDIRVKFFFAEKNLNPAQRRTRILNLQS